MAVNEFEQDASHRLAAIRSGLVPTLNSEPYRRRIVVQENPRPPNPHMNGRNYRCQRSSTKNPPVLIARRGFDLHVPRLRR